MDGFGAAVDRYNSRAGEASQRESAPDKKPGGKSTTHGHVHAIHSHKDGSHHLMVHHGGQLVHHSEHPTFDEAHAAMKEHATGGGGGEEMPPTEV